MGWRMEQALRCEIVRSGRNVLTVPVNVIAYSLRADKYAKRERKMGKIAVESLRPNVSEPKI
jgi:hypothetical protein